MKIAIGSLGFGIGDNLGGSSVVAAKNAIELASRGHEVVFFCTNKKDKKTDLYKDSVNKKIKGIKVIYLKTFTISFWPGSFGPFYIPLLKKSLDKEGPFDIVYLNDYRTYISNVISKWAYKKNVPFIVQPQGTLVMGNKNIFLKWLYDYFFLKDILGKASMVVPVTNAEKDLAVNMGVSRANITVIPTGINIEAYKDIPVKGTFRKSFNLPENKKIILFVGRLDPIKGVDILIEGYVGIKNENNFLVIVGPDYGVQNKIQRLIKKYALEDNVIITGALPDHKDVLSAMNEADILVVPSRSEGFGMVILEGAVLKKPMVISKNCNISDQFEDSALVVPAESKHIADAVNSIIDDKPFLHALGLKAYNKVIEKFQLSKVVDEFENLFTKLDTSNKDKNKQIIN